MTYQCTTCSGSHRYRDQLDTCLHMTTYEKQRYAGKDPNEAYTAAEEAVREQQAARAAVRK